MLDSAGSEGYYSDAPTSTSPGSENWRRHVVLVERFAVVVCRYPHKMTMKQRRHHDNIVLAINIVALPLAYRSSVSLRTGC